MNFSGLWKYENFLNKFESENLPNLICWSGTEEKGTIGNPPKSSSAADNLDKFFLFSESGGIQLMWIFSKCSSYLFWLWSFWLHNAHWTGLKWLDSISGLISEGRVTWFTNSSTARTESWESLASFLIFRFRFFLGSPDDSADSESLAIWSFLGWAFLRLEKKLFLV